MNSYVQVCRMVTARFYAGRPEPIRLRAADIKDDQQVSEHSTGTARRTENVLQGLSIEMIFSVRFNSEKVYFWVGR